MTFAMNLLTRRLNGRPLKSKGVTLVFRMFCLVNIYPRKDHSIYDVSPLLYGNKGGKLHEGGVTSPPVTSGCMYGHFGGKTGDSSGADPVGHCATSRLFNVEMERARPMGRRVVVVRTTFRR